MPKSLEIYLNSNKRLKELESYHLLDTEPEEYLDEITQIASAICDTPISLISLLDNKRQWFKSKHGLDIDETPVEDAFCKFAIASESDEVFTVEDALVDERFTQNPLVTGNPHIRFYAGAPLRTPSGEGLGTLCIIDREKRKITESQKNALKLLAKNVMRYLNNRKHINEQKRIIEQFNEKITALSDEAPGALIQIKRTPDKKLHINYVSNGIHSLHPNLNADEIVDNIELWFNDLEPKDAQEIKNKIQNMCTDNPEFSHTYTYQDSDDSIFSYKICAKGRCFDDGTCILNGSISDTTVYTHYSSDLQQILFDLSHVIRRPVSNLLGISELMEHTQEPDVALIQTYANHIKEMAHELDRFVFELDSNYQEKMKKAITLMVTNNSNMLHNSLIETAFN